MKKLITLLLMLAIVFAASSCNNTKPDVSNSSSSISNSLGESNMNSNNNSNTSVNSQAISQNGISKNDSSKVTTSVNTSSFASDNEKNVTVFRLEDFGGAADGKTNNLFAMKKIILKLKLTQGKKRITFSAGNYFFDLLDGEYAINLNGIYDLDITGAGIDKTNIILGNSHSSFLFIRNSKNISTRNLSVDHSELPYTQGTVVGVDVKNLTVDVKIDSGFGKPTEDWFQVGLETDFSYRPAHLIDPKTGNFKANVVMGFAVDKQVTSLGNDTYRFATAKSGNFAYLGSQAWPKGHIEKGDRIVIASRAAGGHNLYYESCENTLYENLNVYSSTGFAVFSNNISGTAAAINVSVKKKGNRLISGCADGISFGFCRAKPVIDRCYVDSNCDDGISGQGMSPTIAKVESNTKIFVQNVHYTTLKVGDRVSIYNQRVGKLLGETKVVKAEKTSLGGYGDGYWVTLSAPINNMEGNKVATYADLMMCPDFINSGIKITNTTIKNKSGRGVFLCAQDMLIENCKFIDIGGQALMMANEGPCTSNGYTKNVIIRNNLFKNSAYTEKAWDMWAPIHIGVLRGFYPNQGDKTMYITASEPISDNILIENNTFENTAGSFIYLSAVKNCTIKGNKMTTEQGYLSLENDGLIIAENSANVKIMNNTISDKRIGLKAIIDLRGACSNITQQSNSFSCTPGAAVIK